jgi:hypothetical protein
MGGSADGCNSLQAESSLCISNFGNGCFGCTGLAARVMGMSFSESRDSRWWRLKRRRGRRNYVKGRFVVANTLVQ